MSDSRAWRLLALACVALCALAALSPPRARANQTQESLFQDDAYLIYSSTATVNRTLGTLRGLGVQRVRVNVKWSNLAPASASRKRPAGFNAADSAEYPAGVFVPYDRIALLAQRHHIGVEFNITAPGPLWAMRHDSPTARAADHWAPNVSEFFQFVQALGSRYSGTYGGIPRVRVWSIWNEPNQPGWLAPQSRVVAGRWVPNSPRLYREYVQAAFAGLSLTGHSVAGDTILIGELAPEGYSTPGSYIAMTPMPFLRALYCVDARYRPLRSSAAAALGCPASGSRAQFVRSNLGLFYASGFAHHPYYFFYPPQTSSTDPNFVPIANLGRLERGLDAAARAYGIHRRLPIYLTEYGYQTNPPDPYQLVTPAQQAAYINQADYIGWRDPRVRSVAQFLLYDSSPDLRFTPSDFGYWDTFQTGLLFAGGRAKPAYAAYRMPIWIPSPRARRGATMFVWGQLRAAPHNVLQRAEIQWRPRGGSYSTIALVITRNRRGYLTADVRPPGSGELRIAWRSGSGRVLVSRSVAVAITRR